MHAAEKWQRNPILNAIVEGGLDPIECSFDYEEVPWRVVHMPSGSYFLIGGCYAHYKLTSLVGDGQPSESDAYSWSTVSKRVERWAREVKRDVDTPDLWAEVRRRQGILASAAFEDTDNSPFTSDERAAIVEQVRQIKEKLRTYAVPEARMLSIEAKLDYLVSAADRVGRKDWRILFGGVVLSLIAADLLPREVVSDFFTMVPHVLGHIFGDGGGPPELPSTPLH